MATLTLTITNTTLSTITFPYLTQVIGSTQQVTSLGTLTVTDSNLAVAGGDAILRSAFTSGAITLNINGFAIANSNAVGNGVIEGLTSGSIFCGF